MPVISIHDKSAIQAFARSSPFQYLYEIGDLDDFFWPYTSWYGVVDGKQLRELALLYAGVSPPVLLVHTQTGPAGANALVEGLLNMLPPKFYSHLDAPMIAALAPHVTMESHGRYLRMGLTEPQQLSAPRQNAQTLSTHDLPEIRAFYAAAYPDNWFDPRMLETGAYAGLRINGRLAAVAGIHVYSPEYDAAAIGNVAVLPEQRGTGLAQAITAHVCRHLLACGVKTIGLNVRADNAAAIAAYSRIGFAQVDEYFENMCVRK